MKKSMSIQEIENLTEQIARKELKVLEELNIKGFDVLLVEFDDAFGYSRLVFKNGRSIYHANDYQLHHPTMSRYELRNWYISSAEARLFTEEELAAPIKSYDDYRRRSEFLQNVYGQQEENISMFYCWTDPNDPELLRRRKLTETMTYDPISFAYYNDKKFVEKHIKIAASLDTALALMQDDYKYNKEAFLYEMRNHEYGINWQADYDVLSVFGNIRYCGENCVNELENYFDQLKFSETRRRAYRDARRQYFAETECY